MGLSVSSQRALVESCEDERSDPGCRQPAHVVPGELDGSKRAGKGGLAGSDFIVSQDYGRSAWDRHGAGGNIPATMGNLKAKSVNDLIALGLVVLHQNRFFGLILDRFPWTNTRPVENVKIIQSALRLQQVSSFDGRLATELRSLPNQRNPGS